MSGRRAMLSVDLDGTRAGEDELLVMEDFNSEELERMMEEGRARLEVVQTFLLHRRNNMTTNIPILMYSK